MKVLYVGKDLTEPQAHCALCQLIESVFPCLNVVLEIELDISPWLQQHEHAGAIEVVISWVVITRKIFSDDIWQIVVPRSTHNSSCLLVLWVILSVSHALMSWSAPILIAFLTIRVICRTCTTFSGRYLFLVRLHEEFKKVVVFEFVSSAHVICDLTRTE